MQTIAERVRYFARANPLFGVFELSCGSCGTKRAVTGVRSEGVSAPVHAGVHEEAPGPESKRQTVMAVIEGDLAKVDLRSIKVRCRVCSMSFSAAENHECPKPISKSAVSPASAKTSPLPVTNQVNVVTHQDYEKHAAQMAPAFLTAQPQDPASFDTELRGLVQRLSDKSGVLRLQITRPVSANCYTEVGHVISEAARKIEDLIEKYARSAERSFDEKTKIGDGIALNSIAHPDHKLHPFTNHCTVCGATAASIADNLAPVCSPAFKGGVLRLQITRPVSAINDAIWVLPWASVTAADPTMIQQTLGSQAQRGILTGSNDPDASADYPEAAVPSRSSEPAAVDDFSDIAKRLREIEAKKG